MNISQRLTLNQIIFMAVFSILIVMELAFYLNFRTGVEDISKRANRMLSARSQFTSLSDRYTQMFIDSDGLDYSDVLNKIRNINQGVGAIMAQVKPAVTDNEVSERLLQSMEDEFEQVAQNEERAIESLRNEPPSKNLAGTIATLLHYQRLKRALVNDILGYAAAESMESIRYFETTMLWRCLFLMVVAIGALIGSIVSKRYFRSQVIAPLEALNNSLTRLANGDSNVRIEHESDNEVGRIIRNFGQMREKLNESTESLREANKRLEEFAYVAAHDLRAPIASIEGYLQIVNEFDELSDSEKQSYIARARAIVARALKMLESMLTYAKTSRAMPKIVRANVESIVRDVLEDLGSLIANSSANITTHHLSSVHADPQMLHELLQNLIGNAIKYRRAGSHPEVSIWQNQRFVNGVKYDEICVTDNGIGFDMSQKDEIIKPFRRLASAAGYEGTGLGLAVCAQIMRNHQGLLDYTSLVGVGSTFSALFPAHGGSEPKYVKRKKSGLLAQS